MNVWCYPLYVASQRWYNPWVQLFHFPAAVDEVAEDAYRTAASWSAIGRAAELELAAILIERGHSVAQVLVDDGIDLVVDYSIKVQVKTTGRDPDGLAPIVDFDSRAGGRGKQVAALQKHVDPRVDLLAVKYRPTGAWWVIPRDAFGKQSKLRLGKKYAHYRDAWGLFSPR